MSLHGENVRTRDWSGVIAWGRDLSGSVGSPQWARWECWSSYWARLS